MKIVTGYTGTPHITSNDQQAFNQGIFGNGNSVLNVGQKFNATLNSATSVTIEDGEGVLQGVHFRIATGETETLTFGPGTPGYNRIDLICARYAKEPVTGVESIDLVVIEGSPATGAASEPTYNTGDILQGDTPVDFPLWKITLSGLTPTLTKMFSGGGTGVNGIIDMIYPVGSIYMTVNITNPSVFFGGTWVVWGTGRVPLGVYSGDPEINEPEKIGGSKTVTLTTEQIPAHSHTVTVDSQNPGTLNFQSGSASQVLNLGTKQYITSNTGSGQAHENMPPFITCYFFKRTA